jgi:hypothetical protein
VPSKIEDLDAPLVESGQAVRMLTSLLRGIENSVTLFCLELCNALSRLLVDLRKNPVASSYMARLDSSDCHIFTESRQICN